MSLPDRAGLATRHVTFIEKYRSDAEAADPTAPPYELVAIDHGWIDADGTPVTDPDRLARLERTRMTDLKADQAVIVTDDDGKETRGTVINAEMAGVVLVADEHGLPRGVPADWVRAADEED